MEKVKIMGGKRKLVKKYTSTLFKGQTYAYTLGRGK